MTDKLMSRKVRRHPAEVTADRLGDALDRWPDAFTGADRDAIGQIIYALDQIAEASYVGPQERPKP